MHAGHRTQPSAAPQQLSHQKGIAPEIEMPQLEFDKQRAPAQGAGKFFCCRSVTHLIDSSIVSHICNLCAIHWRSSSYMVVFVQRQQTSGKRKQAHCVQQQARSGPSNTC